MNPPTVRTDPVLEAIALKLFGVGRVPVPEQARMIKRAAKAARDAAAAEERARCIAAIDAEPEMPLCCPGVGEAKRNIIARIKTPRGGEVDHG
jgi:hypothetical protein